MASGGYFLLYFTGPVTLADAAARLAPGMHVVSTDDVLAVRWHPDSEPVLWVGLCGEPHVVAEATETAKAHGMPGLAGLDRRFEVGFEDLDVVLDEINTLIEVQTTLQDLTGGYLVLPWNDTVQAPEQVG